MNEWEYLKTKTPEEFTEWLADLFQDIRWGKDNALTSKARAIKWLQAEHTTTADEDFAEIGFANKYEYAAVIQYTDEDGRLFFMPKGLASSYSNQDGENADWNDELIDQIRTIADKKRKELGWDK